MYLKLTKWAIGATTVLSLLGAANFAQAIFEMGGLSASPQKGNAPLLVKFSYIYVQGHTYTIDFGDGSSGSPTFGTVCNIEDCIPTYSTTHTYRSSGTFTAKISEHGNVLGSETITVTGGDSQSHVSAL